MDKDPETLEEAIEQIKRWRELYCAKLQEISEMNEELYRIRAEARAEAARELPEYGWQKRFRETYGIPWDRALSNREAQLHDACKLGWELARAAILADEPKEERGAEEPGLGDVVAYRYGDQWKIGVWCIANDQGVLPARDVVVLERRIEESTLAEKGE